MPAVDKITAATTVPGSDTQLIYNNGGAFGAAAEITWDDTSLTVAAPFIVDGATNAVQATIQAHSTQTSNILEVQNSAGTMLSGFDDTGDLALGSATNYRLTISGAAKGTVYNGINTDAVVSGDIMYYGVFSNTVSGFVNAQLIQGAATSGLNATFFNTETANTGAKAQFQIKTGGAGGGDPFLSLVVSGVTEWTAGIDNSRNDNFAIGTGAPGAADKFSITTGGDVGIGTTSPDTILDINGALTIRELSADPSDPDEGSAALWMSDGTGSGDDGDIMIKITAGATTKTITLVDFSAF